MIPAFRPERNFSGSASSGTREVMMMDKKQSDDIDYLHPEGKPEGSRLEKDTGNTFDEHEAEADAKRRRNSEIDTDGHHMCSQECQRRHKTKV
ncbi:MAG: hypothetical protein ACRD3W_00385 [Terriglobales bacterium]